MHLSNTSGNSVPKTKTLVNRLDRVATRLPDDAEASLREKIVALPRGLS